MDEIELKRIESRLLNFAIHGSAFYGEPLLHDDVPSLIAEVRRLQEKLTITTLENVKGSSVLSDRNEEIKTLRAENARLRNGFQKIIDRKPVLIDGKEWRMEYQDCVKVARQALEVKNG